jgi:alkylated DNA nucleotide flippase Atl1
MFHKNKELLSRNQLLPWLRVIMSNLQTEKINSQKERMRNYKIN